MSEEAILKELNILNVKISALHDAQVISNYLAMSVNPNIPENLQRYALNEAIKMQGLSLQPSEASKQFDEDLPYRII